VPWLALLVALLAPLGPVWLANRNARRAAKEAREASEKIDQRLATINSIVNGRLTAALAKIQQLEAHLLESEGRPPTGLTSYEEDT
jgi:hypothetical protein